AGSSSNAIGVGSSRVSSSMLSSSSVPVQLYIAKALYFASLLYDQSIEATGYRDATNYIRQSLELVSHVTADDVRLITQIDLSLKLCCLQIADSSYGWLDETAKSSLQQSIYSVHQLCAATSNAANVIGTLDLIDLHTLLVLLTRLNALILHCGLISSLLTH